MIGSQETIRQSHGRYSAPWQGAGSRQRQGPAMEALKLEVHRGQLLEGWHVSGHLLWLSGHQEDHAFSTTG